MLNKVKDADECLTTGNKWDMRINYIKRSCLALDHRTILISGSTSEFQDMQFPTDTSHVVCIDMTLPSSIWSICEFKKSGSTISNIKTEPVSDHMDCTKLANLQFDMRCTKMEKVHSMWSKFYIKRSESELFFKKSEPDFFI